MDSIDLLEISFSDLYLHIFGSKHPAMEGYETNFCVSLRFAVNSIGALPVDECVKDPCHNLRE